MDDRNRAFDEVIRTPTQTGYFVAPVLGWLAVALGSVAAALPSTLLGGVAVGLGTLALATALPSALGRVETVVEGGDLYVTVGPEWLSGGDHVRLDAGRIAAVEVVERPVSDPPTDAEGDPLPGYDGEGRNTWPDASVGIPDRPGVVIRVEDGPAPAFPVVVPGEGLRGAFSVGRGPPGFVPSDRPEDLRTALVAARARSAEGSERAGGTRDSSCWIPRQSGGGGHPEPGQSGGGDRPKAAELDESGR